MPTKVPSVPQRPGMQPDEYDFLVKMKKAITELQSSVLPPDNPSNLTITPFALGNNIQFTRSNNAQRYTLYISNSPARNASNSSESIAVDLGNSNYYNDAVGQANYTRYYWVQAWNGNQSSNIIGPKSGKTLAAGTTVNPPRQVPAGHTITTDQTTGSQVPGRPITQPGGRRNT